MKKRLRRGLMSVILRICEGCFHSCHPDEGRDGVCHARGCQNGRIVSLNYGHFTALALDPIEKKPISQADEQNAPETRYLSPEDLCQLAVNLNLTSGNIGVAYTYNEPTVSWEYMAIMTVKAIWKRNAGGLHRWIRIYSFISRDIFRCTMGQPPRQMCRLSTGCVR